MKFKVALAKGNKKIVVKPLAILMTIALGLIFAFFLAEYMVRKLVDFPLRQEYGRFLHLPEFSIPKRNVDETLFWVQSIEFRGGVYSKEKKQGVYRIICLGDSVTQSHGVDGYPLPREQAYAFYLERMLERTYMNREFEVINAGVGGYSSLQGLRYLKNKLIGYHPDLVISWFGINDDSDALFFADKDQRLGGSIDLGKKSFLENSKLYLFLKNIVFRPRLRRVSIEDYYKNCEEMLLLARKNNFDIVFVVPFEVKDKKIEYYLGYKEALEKLKSKYNCPIIDMRSFLNTHEYIDKFFIDNCHAIAEGNKLFAEAISESLRKNKILKVKKRD